MREDFLDKVSTAIAKRYDTIIMEDLNVQGMMRNHRVSKSLSDVSFYAFRLKLGWKATKYGKNLVLIGRFDPSSKLCSSCGNIKHDLKLSERIYRCDACGLIMDRDYNSSRNIRRMGSHKGRAGAARIHACGDSYFGPAWDIPVQADVCR